MSSLEDVINTVFRNGFWRGEVIQHHRNGQPLQIELSVRVIYDTNQNLLGLVGVNRDMTERVQREQANREKLQENANILKRQIDRLHILAEASHALAVIGPNLERRIQAVLEQIARTIGESCVIYLRSSDDNQLHPRAIYHPDPEQVERLWQIAGPIPIPFDAKLNGLEVIRKVHQRSPQIKLLVLSMYTDEAYVLEALRHSTHAYVLKHASASDLTYAIREVLAGRTYLSAPLSERAIAQYLERANEQPQNRYDLLTSREREVLQLVAEGLTNAAVAERLQISSRTAEVHRMNLMRKLDLNSHTDLVRYAIRRGIIPLES
ncbi:MAG: hypothetical protein Fur005_41780 [Roseiflexaceae bacterium]